MELPRLEASASSSEEVADALLSAGACVLTRAASSASASATARELNSQTGFSGAKGSFAGTDSRRNAGKPIGESTGAAELAVAQCVLAPVRAILTKWCRRVALGTCSHITVVHPPEGEPPHPPQVLHRDDGMWGASQWPLAAGAPKPTLSVSAMWALSDFTAANGATRVVLGSHTREDEDLEEAERRSVAAEMAPGDVLLWLGSTLHGAGAHSGEGSAGERSGLLFIYNLGWLRNEHNWHHAMPLEVMRSLSEELQDLIGLTGANAMEHEWYTGPVYTQPYLGAPNKAINGDGVHIASAGVG
mmetsp:Transcript_25660/g.84494  ORF Transcript_25660/g.84494 Transcript_25660/m.84494 type:complete len:302 (-) Transcript_25660:94-999(-)